MSWLKVEIGIGLQKLLCQRLEGCPSEDMIRGTLAAWCDGLEHGKTWDQERDTPRIREAFQRLARTARRWPSLAEFIDALPKISQTVIPRERRLSNDRICETGAKNLKDIASKLGITQP